MTFTVGVIAFLILLAWLDVVGEDNRNRYWRD